MSKEDIIRMAREAGISVFDAIKTVVSDQDGLERFAALVADAEREACAKVCEDYDRDGKVSNIGLYLANKVRARSNT